MDQQTCQGHLASGKECSKRAYYIYNDMVYCGRHAPDKTNKIPKAEVDYTEHYESICYAAKKNKKKGRKGKIILYRMRMMKSVPLIEGYLNVFPNYRHQNRKDGFGCSSLSPMNLGPVKHGQPGLPDSKNIENFHQGSKLFEEEVDNNDSDLIEPGKLYYSNRKSFYLDDVPHRHKYKGTGNNKSIPLCFIWVDTEGKEHQLSYIESRQFYCTFYERLAKKEEDYKDLRALIACGYNLQICGYDAFDIDDPEEAYLDPSHPFGHERVLYTMLTMNKKDYPWRKHKTFDF